MSLRLRILDSITHGPKPPNEDAYGTAHHAAWVIDGATGVSLGPDILAPSGAAWLAASLSDVLATETRPGMDIAGLLALAERGVADRFAAAVDPAREIDAPDLPTGCLGLAVLAGDRLQLGVIGDISLMHRDRARRLKLLSDHAVEAFGERTMEALRRAVRERPDEDPWRAVRVQIRENRRFANQPGGYSVVHPTLPWAHRVTRDEVAVAAGDEVLLASDGFYRLVDHFGLHDPQTLMDAALDFGLEAMVQRLRAIETQDRGGALAPRVKVHDDATAILLRVESTDNTS